MMNPSESFDVYGSASDLGHGGWVPSNAALLSTITFGAGRYGGKCLQCSTSNPFSLIRGLPSVHATVGIGTAFRRSLFASIDSEVLSLQRSGGVQLRVSLTQTGALKILRNTTELATSAPVISVDGWHYIELLTTTHPTAGSYTLRVNGSTVLTASGVNTRGRTDDLIDAISLGMSNVGINRFDDLYTFDGVSPGNVLLGDCIAYRRTVSGDTAQRDFTPDTGTTNFSRIAEEAPDGDSSYVHSGLVGAKDLYAIGNLADVPSVIHAVSVNVLARKDNSATRELRTVLKSGATEAYGSPVGLPNTYKRVSAVHQTDPATGAAWTYEAVNALQAGFQVVT
jgi:hypothetical protein